MRSVRKGFIPLPGHTSPWLDCFIDFKKLIGSSRYLSLLTPSGSMKYVLRRRATPFQGEIIEAVDDRP
jgi:hypothetical protein